MHTRDRPHFFNVFARSQDVLRDVELSYGQEGTVLTLDRQSGARTELLRLQRGWQYRGACEAETVELFVLDGKITSSGDEVGSGGYIFLPQGMDGVDLESRPGATVLLFANPFMPLFPPPHGGSRTIRSWQEAWVETPKPGIQAHGSFHKSLRLPDFTEPFHGGPGGLLRLVMLMPGYADGRQHIHHDCYEEIILLRGDILMPERGLMGPGTFLGNPQEYWHAPVISHGGALLLVQTDAPQGPWAFRPYPNGDAIAEAYLDDTSWIDAPLHTRWDELTEWNSWSERSEYREWKDSSDSEEWSTLIGRGTAAVFRAQHRRASQRETVPPSAES